MSLEQDHFLRECRINNKSSQAIDKEKELNRLLNEYSIDTHKDFKIKKDIIFIVISYLIILLVVLCCLELIVFENPLLIQLFGPPIVPSKKGMALLLSLIGIPLCSIVIIYNIMTFWFKCLVIKKDGIMNKMSLFGCGYIRFEEIESIRFFFSHLTIKYNHKTKHFNCLKITIQQKKIIDKLYLLNKKISGGKGDRLISLSRGEK